MGWQRNRITGELRRVPDSGAPQPWIGKPADPTEPLQAPRMQGQIENTATNTARTRQDMENAQRELALKERAAALEAQIKQAQLAEEQRKANAADPYNEQQLDSSAEDAMDKLKAISRIGRQYQNSTLPVTGFGAETLKEYGGTGAASVETDLNSLKAGGALSEILKMTQATGKNPFTPMSNNDVELIARNRGNLSQKSDADTFFANLGNYQKAYTRAYAGAKGLKALNEHMDRLNLTPAQRADARRRYENDPRVKNIGVKNAPRKQGGWKVERVND